MLRHDKTIDAADLVSLYSSVGWTAYTDRPEWLQLAVETSDHVVTAWTEDGELVGLARAISDDDSIFYLQDILVHPDHQRQGIGRRLLDDCVKRYAHVRQKVLLTDDAEGAGGLYVKAGFVPVDESGLNYVRIDETQ
jgi:ribosomal protein S18 acetylase RimI-like enzyme